MEPLGRVVYFILLKGTISEALFLFTCLFKSIAIFNKEAGCAHQTCRKSLNLTGYARQKNTLNLPLPLPIGAKSYGKREHGSKNLIELAENIKIICKCYAL